MVTIRAVLVVAALVLPVSSLALTVEQPAAYSLMPLAGTPPAWWTPDARAAADAAGLEGKLLNPLTGETTAPAGGIPVGSPDYLFIRPGALFLSGGTLCTFNFIYASGTKIGTAGHCVGSVGQTVYIVAAPTIPLVTPLGTVSGFTNGGIGNDWALININSQWYPYVDANMAYLGGPSCTWSGAGGVGKHVGHGIQTGLVAAVPRVGTLGAGNGNSFSGISEISGGDSGSPIINAGSGTGCAMGAAAGIITHCATLTGIECLPLYWGTDVRKVPATVTPGFDPL